MGFRDMLVAIRENVAKLKRQGHSLDEIVAEPTAAFDAKWGEFLITPVLSPGWFSRAFDDCWSTSSSLEETNMSLALTRRR